ncbi:uncharacterized protein TRIADDRAFT_56765 [Trichoplax adhaerens]|uniref:Origin recognition complex subunit 3 n=1 Tax=Trichoplax adhaerens TaxID=10228 RepID=B3RWI9_TRIAD|nr:hypothetical protein TRIADDRAFT_56765 [Trichoplax adhaerens]EDV24701.1 hypothetical protein TRIADDRAFT_56765 [Trichoplax adhaerens]|eukprot:XP_002112591.1 hypothetical protein TRIADDRAFT_56765 [Trichoplax adhaerens]
MPDNAILFDHLATQIQQTVTPMFARLNSRDCITVEKLVKSFMGQMKENMNDQVSGTEVEITNTTSYSMFELPDWYDSVIEALHRKKQKSISEIYVKFLNMVFLFYYVTLSSLAEIEKPAIIIIFEDFESFSPAVVLDFVKISSYYTCKLPLAFVFGIATTVSAVHKSLTYSGTSLVEIKLFKSYPTKVYLENVLSKVLLTPNHRFKLGFRPLSLLVDNFFCHDFSVSGFMSGLKYAMMDHYYSNELSILSMPSQPNQAIVITLKQQIKALSHEQLELVRMLPSFRKYVDGLPPKEQKKLILEDKLLKDKIMELLIGLEQYHQLFFPMLQCLDNVTRILPKNPLGKLTIEVYLRCIQSNITEEQDFKDSMKLLGSTCSEELISFLTSCIQAIEEYAVNSKNNFALFEYDKYEFLLDGSAGDEEFADNDDDNETDQNQKIDRFKLQERLRQLSKRKKRPTRFENCRSEIVEKLTELFKKYAKCPSEVPLYEVCYYESVSVLKQHVTASPRMSIQKALTDFSSYLKNETKDYEQTPDICVAYQTLEDKKKLVNLEDWMQEFIHEAKFVDSKTLCNGNTKLNRKDKRTNKQQYQEQNQEYEQELQMRFMRAVSELQFLGFIKYSKRKSNYISRLTWIG